MTSIIYICILTSICYSAPTNFNSTQGGMLPVNFGRSASFFIDPLTPPPGALSVDQPCYPSVDRPRPVLLVHGLFSNQATYANTMAQFLKNNGFCVYTFNYSAGDISPRLYGVGDISNSVQTLADSVQQVLQSTSAPKLDIVAHSEGGLVTSLYLRDGNGSNFVQNYVGLAPANGGSTADGLGKLASIAQMIGNTVVGECISCRQLLSDSDFMQNVVKTSPLVVPGVSYTTIRTKYDVVVTPVSSQKLDGPNVQNILIQDDCPFAIVGHTGIADNERALIMALNALDPQNPQPVPCRWI